MKLHLGAGNTPKEGWVNLDIRALPGIDVVRDILRGLPFSDNTFDEVFSENFLEHIPQSETIFVMNEIWRVLTPGGRAEHFIPPAGSMNFYQDPTHLSHWSIETFNYYKAGNYKNEYYGDAIKPWVVESLALANNDQIIHVVLKKHAPTD